MNICDKIGYIFGLLASTTFISMLIPPSFEPFVFVIWILISSMLIDVVRNWILEVTQKLCNFAKDVVSYLHDSFISSIFIDVVGNWILKAVQNLHNFVKDVVSYLHDSWKQIVGNNNNVEIV